MTVCEESPIRAIVQGKGEREAFMRGIDHQQGHVFSYFSPEDRLRKDHPLRAVRAMADEIKFAEDIAIFASRRR